MKVSQPNKKNSTIGFGLVVKVIEWLFVCTLFPLLIAIILLVFKGHVAGLMYLQKMFHEELLWLKTFITQTNCGQGLFEWILQSVKFLQTESASLIYLNSIPATVHYAPFKKMAAFICPLLVAYGSALLLTLQLTLLRMTTFLLFAPLFLLLGMVGFIDGTVQRYLRRINGGRESTLIYHQARNAVLPILFLGSSLYIVLPFSLSPVYLLLPIAVLLAVCLFFTAKMFKKYL